MFIQRYPAIEFFMKISDRRGLVPAIYSANMLGGPPMARKRRYCFVKGYFLSKSIVYDYLDKGAFHFELSAWFHENISKKCMIAILPGKYCNFIRYRRGNERMIFIIIGEETVECSPQFNVPKASEHGLPKACCRSRQLEIQPLSTPYQFPLKKPNRNLQRQLETRSFPESRVAGNDSRQGFFPRPRRACRTN